MASSTPDTVSTKSKSNASNSARYALTPLKKPKKGKPFSVGDIESRKWTEFLIIGHYDGETVSYFTNLKDFFAHVFAHPHDTVFFHFGGIFDFLFLLGEILETPTLRLESLIPRGSGMLCFTVSNGHRSIHFRDSSALLPFSLRKLAESFGVKTQKGEIDYEKIEKVTPELKKYLESDLLALFQVLTRFYESEIVTRSGPKTTIASQSLQVLRTYISKPISSCPDAVDRFARDSYAGGRTEIFRPLFTGPGELRCYDINSLYPSVMQSNEFPGEFVGWSTKLDLERPGFHEVYVEVGECYAPILWKKTPKFIFPIGRFWGVYSTPELRAAIASGQAVVLRHRQSAYFTNSGRIFGDFVSDLYNRRKNSESEVEKTIIKLVLNSCYGRIGLNLEKEGLELDYGQENVIPSFEVKHSKGTSRFVRTTVNLKSFSHPGIASYVTAFARLKNWEYLRRFESTIHYTDTDSFFTPEEHANSTNLGELKLESLSPRACFLLPKTYVAGKKVAMKGFSNRKIQHFQFEDFQTALEGDLKMLKIQVDSRMNRFRSAMKQGGLLNMSKASTKQIQSRYDKRILFRNNAGNWDSRPIVLNEKITDRGN